MKHLAVVGALLVGLGAGGLVSERVTCSAEDSFQISASGWQAAQFPDVAGAGAILVGIVLLFASKREI